MGMTSRRLHLLLPCHLPPRGSRELLCHFLALLRHHHPGANSSPLRPGRKPTTPLPAMLLAKKTLLLARRTVLASRNTAALFSGYSDTGLAVMEEALGCRRLRCSRRMSIKNQPGRPHLCMLLRHELILLRRMQGLPSALDLLARLRLLLPTGIINHGRVSFCG